MKLIIVESPAKARTINKYLGKDFSVIASFGHVRAIPSKPGCVLPDSDFKIKYGLSKNSTTHIKKIVDLAKKSDQIYLATDPDREGEAIAWHIMEVLNSKKAITNNINISRIAFNEITKKAVINAVENPRNINVELVNAQQARQALDYLVGFTLSPVLWRKLPGCRSAGRVQSVALRLVCERELEREEFKSQEYWDIQLDVENNNRESFISKLFSIDKKKLGKFDIPNQDSANQIVSQLHGQNFLVDKILKKQQIRSTTPPFITSSLQQEAARKLNFSAKKTMQVAQRLYEGVDINGTSTALITYMRTDGTYISQDAIKTIRNVILEKYGDKYLPSKNKLYKSKSKNAQEAHEAIRPINPMLLPSECKDKLEQDQFRLYELIWKRTIASQMENAILDIVTADLLSDDTRFIARANGSSIKFDGFYKIYQESIDDKKQEQSKMLPILQNGEQIKVKKITPNQHFTEPKPRYSEATLVKTLEELGIGRPSTYASIISVLQDRNYVKLEKKRFYPNDLGRLLNAFLKNFFTKYVEYDFTASLEIELDKIAGGELQWKSLLKNFWYDFDQNISIVQDKKIGEVIDSVQKSLHNYLFANGNKCNSCMDGSLSLKLGKYGAFLACNNYPDCNYKKTVISHDSDNSEIQNTNLGELDGKNIHLKKGPYGWYVQLDTSPKPKRISLPSDILPDKVDINIATKLLSLPINIGKHPDGEDITISTGKFGPYIKYNGKFLSISKDINLFDIDLTRAVDLISEKYKN